MVKTAKAAIDDTMLIVGGGIRTDKQAALLAKAGADVIVTGTVIEEDTDIENKIASFVSAIQH
jgi:phosphoglycerol geranylgeranyltransferase